MTSPPAPRLPRLLSFLILALLVGLVYGPSALAAEHLNFDDPLFFGPDSAFAQGGLGRVLDPTQTIANAYLPVAHLSLYFDWALGGPTAPWIPRLHSALLHAVAAFVLARLLARLGLPAAGATAAAALFALHPALAESVAWSSSRKDVLSGLGVFACLSACLRTLHAATPRGRRWAMGRAVLWALFALYAKATAVVVAPLALWFVWWARRSAAASVTSREARATQLALFVVAILAGVHHATLAAHEGTLGNAASAGLGGRLPGVPGAFVHYLATIVWPRGLNVLYPEVLTLQAFAARVAWASLVLASVVLAGAFALRQARTRLAGVGAFAALIALLPFNTALPASSIAAADRYLYLALPWAALAVAALGGRFAVPLCAVLALGAGAASCVRARAFADSTTLWRQSLAQDPRNAVACLNLALTPGVAGDPTQLKSLLEQAATWARYPQHALRAHGALASAAWQDERREAALRHAQEALVAARALPDGEVARHERVRRALLGAVMAQACGETARADEFAADALALAPEHAAVLAYRASVLLRGAVVEGKLASDADAARAQATELLDRAVAADPAAPDPYVVRGQWHAAAGANLAAVKCFDDALVRAPTHRDAHASKVDLLLAQGLFAPAEAAARRAIALHVDDAHMLSKLGMALFGQRKLADARSFYEDALRLRPRDTSVRRLLAGVLVLETRPLLFQLPGEQLQARAERIRDLEPDHAEAALFLAVARRHQRKLRDALVLLEGARSRLPHDDDVERLLAETHRDLGYQLLLAGAERDRGIDHLHQFCQLAPRELDTAAARMVIEQEVTQQENAGVAAFGKEEFAQAEAHFRRCLALQPDRAYTRYQLGLTLLQRGGEGSQQALALLRSAEEGLRAQGHDASRAVLYQIIALRRLGETQAAQEKARAFVAAAENETSAAFERIRELAK